MFDVTTNLTSVSQHAGRPAWLWSVEFVPVPGTDVMLRHAVEGIAADLDYAQMEMRQAEVIGKARLEAMGFEIKDTIA